MNFTVSLTEIPLRSHTIVPHIKKTIISRHNKKLLEKPPTVSELCNCKSKIQCPVMNKCNFENVIYKAVISSEKNKDISYT